VRNSDKVLLVTPKTRTIDLIAVPLSAIAFYFGTGLHPHWWLTWLAAIPVLVFAYHSPARVAALAAFVAYALGELNFWTYFQILEIPIAVRCLAVVATAMAFVAGVMLSRAFVLRGNRILAVLALPVLWESFEFAMSWGRNGTALNLSYSQMNCLPLLQLASITGIWGIGFFVFFFASAVAGMIHLRKFTREFAVPLAAVALLVLGFGVVRSGYSPDTPRVRIGLAASDQRPLLGDEQKTTAITESYSKSIKELAKQGAEVIVLPEKIMTTPDYRAGSFYQAMQAAAARDSVLVVAGVDQKGEPLKHNLAFAISPSTDLLYEKHHMVVGWEDGYQSGAATVMLPAPHSSWGIEICKDMDFPALSRTYSKLGADLILVPAWDFEIDDWLHGRMAVMRGVESGFAIARSAKQGFMTISDNRGRILFERRSDPTGTAQVIGTVKLYSSQTLYARFGDWFAWMNLFDFAALLTKLALTRRP